MAEEPGVERNAPGIARASKRKWGYDERQVDEFLENAHSLYESEGVQLTQHDIQNISFDLRKGGYVIAQVDAALTRLERAVVDKQTAWQISQNGRVAWKAQTEELFRELEQHATRPEGTRFKDGEVKKTSYDRKQVDRLINQVIDKTSAVLGIDGAKPEDAHDLVDLNSATVANVIFTQRKGKRGYDERQVDYFLNHCVQLLTQLESYERVSDYMGGHAASESTASEPIVQDKMPELKDQPGVSSLFASQPQGLNNGGRLEADTPQSFAPSLPSHDSSQPRGEADSAFDDLQRRERAIFNASAAPVGNSSDNNKNAGLEAGFASNFGYTDTAEQRSPSSSIEPQSSLAALAHKTVETPTPTPETEPRHNTDSTQDPSQASQSELGSKPVLNAEQTQNFSNLFDSSHQEAGNGLQEQSFTMPTDTDGSGIAGSHPVESQPLESRVSMSKPSDFAESQTGVHEAASQAWAAKSESATQTGSESRSGAAPIATGVSDWGARPAETEAAQHKVQDLFGSLHTETVEPLSIDIPDLSFPILRMNTTADENNESEQH